MSSRESGRVSEDSTATTINRASMVLHLGFAAGVAPLATTQSMGGMSNAALRPAGGLSRQRRTHSCGHAPAEPAASADQQVSSADDPRRSW